MKFTEAAPGDDEFISVYQKALTDYIEQLPATELDRLEAKAEKWNTMGPPKEIKRM